MTQKNLLLALVLLATLGLGWVLSSTLRPSQTDPAPATGSESPGGAGSPTGAGGPDAPGPAGQDPAPGEAGGDAREGPGIGPQKLALLKIRVVDGAGGELPRKLRIALAPATDAGGLARQLRGWAASKAASKAEALAFGGEGGMPLSAKGEGQVRVPSNVALRLNVGGAGLPGGPRSMRVEPLEPGEQREFEIDLASGAAVAGEPTAGDGEGRPGQRPGGQKTGQGGAGERDAGGRRERFHGLVLAGPDEAPLAEASVLVRGREIARTDAEGRFEVPYDPNGAALLRIEARGAEPVVVQAVPGYGSPGEARRITLKEGASAAVQVLDPGGRPESGVLLTLATDVARLLAEGEAGAAAAFEADLGEVVWTAGTNALGMAFFEGLPADAPLAIRLARPGDRQAGLGPRSLPGIPAEVTLAAGERWSPSWTLPTPPTLRGRVVDQAGEPVSGAPVWLVAHGEGETALARYLTPDDAPSARQMTDDEGRFLFRGIEPGAWLVGVAPISAAKGVPWQMGVRSLALPTLVGQEGAPRAEELLLVVGRGLTIHGVVLDPQGRPAAGALLEALEEHGRGAMEARADERGEFTVGPLSQGTFFLLVAGCATCGIERFGPIHAGAREVVLRLAEEPPFEGRVAGQDGSARAAEVCVFESGVLRAQILTKEPEDPGRFRVALRPGTYDFVAETEDGQVGAVRDLAFGGSLPLAGLEIPVEPGARIDVHYSGERPWRHVAFQHDGRPFAVGLVRDGVPRQQFVPAGRIRVVLQSVLGEPLQEREVALEVGGEAEVLFDLLPEPAAPETGDAERTSETPPAEAPAEEAPAEEAQGEVVVPDDSDAR